MDDIKEYGIETDAYETFLERRAERIENEFRVILGLTTKTEHQLGNEPSKVIDLSEDKIRDLLDHYLSQKYGEDYWEEGVPKDVRDVADKRIAADLIKHPYNETKYINCRERLNFLDMVNYLSIIQSKWWLFEHIFKSKGEVKKHLLALNDYRNAIKHNRKIDPVCKKNGEAGILWFEKIVGSEDV